MSFSEVLTVLAFILLFLLIVIGGPLAGIWSVNTLFSLDIPYKISSWAAMLILWIMISPGPSKSNKN